MSDATPKPRIWASIHGERACRMHGMDRRERYAADHVQSISHLMGRFANAELHVVDDCDSGIVAEARLRWLDVIYHHVDRRDGTCAGCDREVQP